MTPTEVFAKVDALIQPVLGPINQYGAAFLAAHGGYWQAFSTHATPPLDGIETSPTVGVAAPHDQPNPWPAQFLIPIPMAITLDVYEGSLGVGYIARLTVRVTGTTEIETWERVLQIGPVPELAHGWEQVLELEMP